MVGVGGGRDDSGCGHFGGDVGGCVGVGGLVDGG